MTESLYTRPKNEELEKAVLGAILMSPSKIYDALEFITEDSFYSEKHRAIFRAIMSLTESQDAVDLTTVFNRLSTDAPGLVDVGLLADVVASVGSSTSLRTYAKELAGYQLSRSALGIAERVAVRIRDNDGTPSEIVADAENELVHLSEGIPGSTNTHVSEFIADALDYDNTPGLPTGWYALDKLLDGLRPGNLVVFGGRPGSGKTVAMMNIAQHVAVNRGKPVLVFSLEMQQAELTRRLLASEARSNLRNTNEERRIEQARERLEQAPLYIEYTPGIRPRELIAKARRYRKRYGVELIVVDYLQLMSASRTNDNRALQIAELTGSLKNLAGQLSVPIIAGSQLNRESGKDNNTIPRLEHLRESGAIEQDADKVVLIHRERDAEGDYTDVTVFDVAKNRNGALGVVEMTLHGEYTRFDVSTEDESPF